MWAYEAYEEVGMVNGNFKDTPANGERIGRHPLVRQAGCGVLQITPYDSSDRGLQTHTVGVGPVHPTFYSVGRRRQLAAVQGDGAKDEAVQVLDVVVPAVLHLADLPMPALLQS